MSRRTLETQDVQPIVEDYMEAEEELTVWRRTIDTLVCGVSELGSIIRLASDDGDDDLSRTDSFGSSSTASLSQASRTSSFNHVHVAQQRRVPHLETVPSVGDVLPYEPSDEQALARHELDLINRLSMRRSQALKPVLRENVE